MLHSPLTPTLHTAQHNTLVNTALLLSTTILRNPVQISFHSAVVLFHSSLCLCLYYPVFICKSQRGPTHCFPILKYGELLWSTWRTSDASNLAFLTWSCTRKKNWRHFECPKMWIGKKWVYLHNQALVKMYGIRLSDLNKSDIWATGRRAKQVQHRSVKL